MEQNKSNKLTIIAVCIAFLSPFVISWWVLNYSSYVEDGDKSNNGDLIQPPRPLDNMVLDVPSDPDAENQLHGKWNIVYVADKCEQACMDNLYKMRQIHIAMDKNSLRVQRLLLSNNQSESLNEIITSYPRLRFVQDKSLVTPALFETFRLEDGKDPLNAERLYIIDPMGNLMMSYLPDTNPRDIMKDLKKLLRASRIG